MTWFRVDLPADMPETWAYGSPAVAWVARDGVLWRWSLAGAGAPHGVAESRGAAMGEVEGAVGRFA